MERKYSFKFSAMVEVHTTLDGETFYSPVIRWNPHADNHHYPATVIGPGHLFPTEALALEWLHGTVKNELSGPITRWTDR